MKKKLQRWAPVVVLALISAVLLYLLPEAREPFGSALIDYAKELIIVLPAVLLMGLLSTAR